MRLLLDTHAFLWWIGDDPQLSDQARAAIGAETSWVAVSAATVWEISIKEALGRLEIAVDPVEQIAANRFVPLPIAVEHARAAGSLPSHHRDPFDRVLVAQAQAEGLTLVTRDPRFARYGVATLAT